MSQDVFQIKMDMIVEKCPETVTVDVNVAVCGKNEDHYANHLKLMMVAAKEGSVFSSSKCKIKKKKNSSSFYGWKFTNTGMKPGPAKIQGHASTKWCHDTSVIPGHVQFSSAIYVT